MRHSVSPLDDSLLGGEPGSYSRLGTAAGLIVGVLGKAAHGVWKAATRYQAVLGKQDEMGDKLDEQATDINALKTSHDTLQRHVSTMSGKLDLLIEISTKE